MLCFVLPFIVPTGLFSAIFLAKRIKKCCFGKLFLGVEVTHSLSHDINTGSVNNVNCDVIVEVLDYLG